MQWRVALIVTWSTSVCLFVWVVCFRFSLFLCSHSDLSFAVPVANALSFLCTLLTGKLLGEEFGGISEQNILTWWVLYFYEKMSVFRWYISPPPPQCCRGCHGNVAHHGWHHPVRHKLHWWAGSQGAESDADYTLMEFGIKVNFPAPFWIPQQGGNK